MNTSTILSSGDHSAHDKGTDDFEARAYPTFTPEMHNWLREQRGLIRAFLASDYGRTQGALPKTTMDCGQVAISATH